MRLERKVFLEWDQQVKSETKVSDSKNRTLCKCDENRKIIGSVIECSFEEKGKNYYKEKSEVHFKLILYWHDKMQYKSEFCLWKRNWTAKTNLNMFCLTPKILLYESDNNIESDRPNQWKNVSAEASWFKTKINRSQPSMETHLCMFYIWLCELESEGGCQARPDRRLHTPRTARIASHNTRCSLFRSVD